MKNVFTGHGLTEVRRRGALCVEGLRGHRRESQHDIMKTPQHEKVPIKQKKFSVKLCCRVAAASTQQYYTLDALGAFSSAKASV